LILVSVSREWPHSDKLVHNMSNNYVHRAIVCVNPPNMTPPEHCIVLSAIAAVSDLMCITFETELELSLCLFSTWIGRCTQTFQICI
jgi:hypothetical protein